MNLTIILSGNIRNTIMELRHKNEIETLEKSRLTGMLKSGEAFRIVSANVPDDINRLRGFKFNNLRLSHNPNFEVRKFAEHRLKFLQGGS